MTSYQTHLGEGVYIYFRARKETKRIGRRNQGRLKKRSGTGIKRLLRHTEGEDEKAKAHPENELMMKGGGAGERGKGPTHQGRLTFATLS